MDLRNSRVYRAHVANLRAAREANEKAARAAHLRWYWRNMRFAPLRVAAYLGSLFAALSLTRNTHWSVQVGTVLLTGLVMGRWLDPHRSYPGTH